MKKTYYVDTCALLEGYDIIDVLRNGEENRIKISITTLNELDGLMKSSKRHKAIAVVKNLLENLEKVEFIGDTDKIVNNDDIILTDAKKDMRYPNKNDIFVTNDLLLQLKAHACGVKVEEYKSANPFDHEEPYSGFVNWENGESLVNNCFFFKEGKLHHYINGEEKPIVYQNAAWNVKPKDVYQNAALELLKNKNIAVKTIQSKAGTGKSYLSLAQGLREVFELKNHKKLMIVKHPSNIGDDLGFLPGDIMEKMDPHWRPLYNLLLKLQEKRPFNKGWLDPNSFRPYLNPRYIEFIPMNFLRGENIDDAFVVISEGQNITRKDMRSLLSRMGDNVSLVIEGDIRQIDNPNCTEYNNGLNWVAKLFKGDPAYGHLTMNCKKTRGPICDMVNSYKL